MNEPDASPHVPDEARATPDWPRLAFWTFGGVTCVFGMFALFLYLNPPQPKRRASAPRGDAQFEHGMNLAVRQWDERNVTPKTRRVSVEVYRDVKTGAWVYVTKPDVTRKGSSIAVVPTSKAP